MRGYYNMTPKNMRKSRNYDGGKVMSGMAMKF